MTLLTSAQAAEILETKEVTLNRLAREKLIPSTKNGRNFMFDSEDVKAYKEVADKLKPGYSG